MKFSKGVVSTISRRCFIIDITIYVLPYRFVRNAWTSQQIYAWCKSVYGSTKSASGWRSLLLASSKSVSSISLKPAICCDWRVPISRTAEFGQIRLNFFSHLCSEFTNQLISLTGSQNLLLSQARFYTYHDFVLIVVKISHCSKKLENNFERGVRIFFDE